ncbi:MAG: glycosyltransferase [Alteromonadaceae bacterium]|nr:glycosyltransferase [Alteromonadaceae bacterium]
MSRPIRVLHVTFNMGIGGTEQVIRQLVMGLDPAEVQQAIACIDGEIGALGEQLRALGVRVIPLPRQPGFDRALIRRLRETLKTGDFDVVHCHQYTPWAYGWFAALGTGVRVVFTEHGRFYPDRYRYKALLVNQLMARSTKAMVAISEATRQALARYEFLPARHIKVIYNGIVPLKPDPDALNEVRRSLAISHDDFVVGTVSRLDPVKNQRMMLRAFASFAKACPRALLLMVGDGPERQALETQAGELGIAGRVRFTGFIETPVNHLALMDVFLLSSHTEGTSMTLLEAMCLGIPPVVTRVGGNPEIVEEQKTGLVVAPDDEQGFANALNALWQSPALRTQLGEAAKARFKARFSRQHMLAGYLGIYQRCQARRAG